VHFEYLQAAGSPTEDTSQPVRRAEILRSLPDGLALAAYARGSGELPRGWLRTGGASTPPDALPGGVSLPSGASSFLPPEMRALAGDEIAIALLGVEPTAIAPVPNLAIVLELQDPAAAARTLRTLESTFDIVRVQGQRHRFEDVAYGGTTFRSLAEPLSQTLTPSWMVADNVAIATTTREFMQQIVDTRRTGRRTLEGDASFRDFRAFIPEDVAAVAYADQRRLHRALEQLEPSTSRWGPGIARLVREMTEYAALGQHFPAGAAYATREEDRIAVRGWLREKD
jgi:hypothetical protein